MENDLAKIPTYDRLMDPLFKAIRALGGSGTIDEINKKVIEISSIADQILEIPHGKTALSEGRVPISIGSHLS
jgi:restriction system protein